MYIAPSSGHISLNLNMPFKLILRRFEVVFWCLKWECCTFWKIDGNSFKSTNTILWLWACHKLVTGLFLYRLAFNPHDCIASNKVDCSKYLNYQANLPITYLCIFAILGAFKISVNAINTLVIKFSCFQEREVVMKPGTIKASVFSTLNSAKADLSELWWKY